jgi:hypothetical protein
MVKSKFSNDDLTRWKREINPSPIIGSRVPLRRENAEYLGLCPFHPDKNPSFKVWKSDEGVWGFKCFGCGEAGNVFQFVQKFDQIPFTVAVAKVLTEAGVAGWEDGQSQADPKIPDQTPKETVTFPMAQYQPATAALERSPAGQKWLAARGITMETARKFHLGFVQSAAAISNSNSWVNDGWVLFPTISTDVETVTAVKYRSLIAKKGKRPDGHENSGILRAPDTSTTLYNLQTVTPQGDVWVCEGEPDTLVLAQAGLTAVGYPMAGYKPTEEECELLSSAKRRFLAGDNDAVGSKAMAGLLARLRGETHVIRWPNNRKDANDVLTNECGNDPAKFRALVGELQARATRTGPITIEFHTPALPDPDGEYVVAPAEHQEDGWFPLGDISLIGGASGTGKTTWIFEMLHKQKQGWEVLGHSTFKHSFHVLAYDRGANAFTRTLRRLNLAPRDIPTTPLPLSFGTDAVQNIINEIEKMRPTPNIIFIEGLDMLLDDANKKSVVSPFMRQMQETAAHFHIALICSVGAPKTKRGEDYAAKRDKLSGSEAWGRNCETVCVLEFSEEDDGTAPQRELTILPRNAPAEKFTLQFEGGRLVPVKATEEEEPDQKPTGRPPLALQKAVRFLERELQDGTRKDSQEVYARAQGLERISRSTLDRAIDSMHIKTEMEPYTTTNPRSHVVKHGYRVMWSLEPMSVGGENNIEEMNGQSSPLLDYGSSHGK